MVKSNKFCIFVTASSPESRECPHSGKFSVIGLSQEERRSSGNSAAQISQNVENTAIIPSGCSQDFTTLRVGCSTYDTMEFRTECMRTDTISGIRTF
jgi:hypothetical protein